MPVKLICAKATQTPTDVMKARVCVSVGPVLVPARRIQILALKVNVNVVQRIHALG